MEVINIRSSNDSSQRIERNQNSEMDWVIHDRKSSSNLLHHSYLSLIVICLLFALVVAFAIAALG